jgi:hypothetical protein
MDPGSFDLAGAHPDQVISEPGSSDLAGAHPDQVVFPTVFFFFLN